jgi:hypothetical protein
MGGVVGHGRSRGSAVQSAVRVDGEGPCCVKQISSSHEVTTERRHVCGGEDAKDAGDLSN